MKGRQIKTGLPSIMMPSQEKVDKGAKARDKVIREETKCRFDKVTHAKEEKVSIGSKQLIKQDKMSIKPPFDPAPYIVTKVNGTQVTARKGGKERKRYKSNMVK